jgi:hypothetical protein
VKPPCGRHGTASPLALVHHAAVTDDQVGTFPDECSDGDPSPSGKVLPLLHLGFGKLNLCADHGDLLGDTDTIFATMITDRYDTGK